MSDSDIVQFSSILMRGAVAQINVRFDSDTVRNEALANLGADMLGLGIVGTLRDDGPDRARLMTVSFLELLARVLSKDGRTVGISVDWREGV